MKHYTLAAAVVLAVVVIVWNRPQSVAQVPAVPVVKWEYAVLADSGTSDKGWATLSTPKEKLTNDEIFKSAGVPAVPEADPTAYWLAAINATAAMGWEVDQAWPVQRNWRSHLLLRRSVK